MVIQGELNSHAIWLLWSLKFIAHIEHKKELSDIWIFKEDIP